MSQNETSDTGQRGILSRIASSAEYSIAAALLAVCVVVGGALWWLSAEETAVESATSAQPASTATPAVDERAAIDDWQRKLGEQFSALDEQQRKQAADEEARRARQRAADEAATEARRQAELAAQAQRQAEARMRDQAAAARPTPAAVQSVAVLATAEPRQPPRETVFTDAAIDWSSCRRPSYPSISVDRKEEGVVMIAVDLDATAKILQTRVAESSGFARLDRVTLEAVGKCRFTPAREDGVARAATAQVRFTWKLR